MRLGVDHEQIHASCRVDPWFLERIQEIVDTEARVLEHGLPAIAEQFRLLKRWASRMRVSPSWRSSPMPSVRKRRIGLGVRPVFKRHRHLCRRVCLTPTAYMTPPTARAGPVGDGQERRGACLRGQPLGTRQGGDPGDGGAQPHRPGHRVRLLLLPRPALRCPRPVPRPSWSNCNPETVSTDYDTSDRLYFEPLTADDVLEIIAVEQSRGRLRGVIVQFGRADAAQARARARGGRRCRSWALSP